MSGAQATTPRPPGRPRSAEADAAIARATLQVLVEDGYRNLSIERVRTIAGVGKTTIYRRYKDKAELAKAAIRHLHSGLQAPEDTGSLRGDLDALRHAAITAATTVGAALFLPRVLVDAAGEPELHAIFRATLVEPRRTAMRTVFERGVERGELRDDLDLEVLVDLLTAPYLYRLLIDAGDVATALSRVDEYVEVILNGAARPSPAAPSGTS